MNKTNFLILILVVFLVSDLAYSFCQYYFISLDGDIAGGVVPGLDVKQVLDDPFGFHMLKTGEKHVNPNRFFAHFIFKEYMQKVPIYLQSFTDNISSVYFSCALVKFMIHITVIFILSALISGTKKLLSRNFLISACLVVPLIQANGYWGHMGINDKSITYTFFYALPLVLLMVYLTTLYRIIYWDETRKIGLTKLLYILVFAVILPLSGPLIPALILIISVLIGIYYLQKLKNSNTLISTFRKVPFQVYIFLVPACLVSLYSLFLGRFDSNYLAEVIPISERYLKLPLGIYYQISQSLGVPLLLIIIGVNLILIKKKFYDSEGQKIVHSLKWIGIFSVIYLLLLPLGGYRPYRPNILRYDTFMPITLALLYLYGMSSFFLLRNLNLKSRNIYVVVLILFCSIYMNSDRLKTKEYYCERKSIEFLANSADTITILPYGCNIMAWYNFSDPQQSILNAELLHFWGITKEKKLYYQNSVEKIKY
jgi:hypothetical protein